MLQMLFFAKISFLNILFQPYCLKMYIRSYNYNWQYKLCKDFVYFLWNSNFSLDGEISYRYNFETGRTQNK